MFNIPNEDLEKELKELVRLYKLAKKQLLLLETYSNKSHLGVINELRGALDHIMRAFADGDIDILKGAKGHIQRAAYDSIEVLMLLNFKEITELIKSVSPDVLLKVFPQYYSSINKRLHEIRNFIEKNRNDNYLLFKDGNQHLIDESNNYLEELIALRGTVYDSVEKINEAAKSEKKKEFKKKLSSNLIKIAVGIILGVSMMYIKGCYSPNSQNTDKSNTIEISSQNKS